MDFIPYFILFYYISLYFILFFQSDYALSYEKNINYHSGVLQSSYLFANDVSIKTIEKR